MRLPQFPRAALGWLIAASFLCCSLSALADTHTTQKPGKPEPNRIGEQLWVIGEEVLRDQWPGTLPLVNAPQTRKMALPGQCISIAVIANGNERDTLLKDTAFNFEIEFDGKKNVYKGLHPSGIKRLKPEGGDFVSAILGAANVDQSSIPDMSVASLATFDLNWCVPQNSQDGVATLTGSAVQPKAQTVHFKTLTLPVASFATAVKQGEFKNKGELGEWLMNYYHQPNPARVLPACRMLANDNLAFAPNVRTFLIEVLRSSPEAASDLQTRLADETPDVRGYAMYMLQQAGYDIKPLLAQMPEKDSVIQEEFIRRIPPLFDPYDLRVDVQHFDTPKRMDALWSIFLVTGKQKPVRAIADLLAWHDDYAVVREARKSPKKSNMTQALGQGISYMTAGWSLGSFARNHGLVADFVDAWKADANTPKDIKNELTHLEDNEAFQRGK